MVKNYKQENILLFIGIGILIVIFLYYNNFTLYTKNNNIKNNNIANNNIANNNITNNNDVEKEGFVSKTLELPTFEQAEDEDVTNEIKRTNLLTELYKFLIPYEDENTDVSNTNARYNVLSLFTKKYKEEIALLNNKNNLYVVNKNNLNNVKNALVSNQIDLRENGNGEYANTVFNNLINIGNGVNINVEFLSNFTYPVKYNCPVRFIIEDKSYDGSSVDELNTKKYQTDNMRIEPISATEFHLIFNIPNNNEKYPELNINTTVDGENKVINLYHQIVIKLVLNTDIDKITKEKAEFMALLENINIFESKYIYRVYDNEMYNSGNMVFEFESRFILNKIDVSKDLNEYTKQRLKDMHIETLNENYNVIVSDMFNLDNKISKKEKIIQNIKNHYLLNELSNTQNNIKFYNTY